jgi:hypothetical protein
MTFRLAPSDGRIRHKDIGIENNLGGKAGENIADNL